MKGNDCLIRLKMVGAVDFYHLSEHTRNGTSKKCREYNILDLITGMQILALRVDYMGHITRVAKQPLVNAIQQHGNTAARYQIVTANVQRDYLNGAYETSLSGQEINAIYDAERMKHQRAKRLRSKKNAQK